MNRVRPLGGLWPVCLGHLWALSPGYWAWAKTANKATTVHQGNCVVPCSSSPLGSFSRATPTNAAALEPRREERAGVLCAAGSWGRCPTLPYLGRCAAAASSWNCICVDWRSIRTWRGSFGTMEGLSVTSQAIPVSEDAYCNSSTAPVEAAGSSSPAVAKLRKLLFRRMLIGVNDGRYFLGLFHCIDKQGNIILQDAVEYRSARHSSPLTEQRCLGLILIPAACRLSCQVDCSVEEKMSLLCLD